MTKNEALSNRKFAETEQAITDYEKIKEAFIIAKSENESLRQERLVISGDSSSNWVVNLIFLSRARPLGKNPFID